MYLAKDFIETAEKLVFAIVESGEEEGKILCFLRYIQQNSAWKKLNTDEANKFLADTYPEYLHYSCVKQVHCHAVALDKVYKHHKPREKLVKIVTNRVMGTVERDLVKICDLLEKNGLDSKEFGVTGSILIGAQQQSSDIDLVFYSRETFNQARKIVQKLIKQADCHALSEEQWLDSFDRRSCDLNYTDYVWHEKRKFNKAIINQRKIDFSFVTESIRSKSLKKYKKLEAVQLKVQVIDDFLAFDYPAAFTIQHPTINSIVSYTATYTGQAEVGEWIEVAGRVEEDNEAVKRIVIGSSREAKGEYIKVINNQIKLPGFSAVIFDMDGLVLDTEMTYCLAWKKTAAQMGTSLSDDFCLSLLGLHFQEIEKKLIEHCGVEFDLKQFVKLSGTVWRDYVEQHGVRVKKGFFNLLKVLENSHTPFCLATNSRKDNALECLELAGLSGIFSSMVTRDDVVNGKPEPDIFIEAAKVINTPVNQCLVLEDSKTGIQAATNANAPCVYIPSIYPPDRITINRASCYLRDLDELAQIIQRELSHPV